MGSVNNGPRPGYPPPRRKPPSGNQLEAAKINRTVGSANKTYQDALKSISKDQKK